MDNTTGNNLGCLSSIGLIAILAAILFPVFAQSRDKAKQTVCLSNEKQIGLGILQYTEDYDECMPDINYKWNRKQTWRKMIYPYVKNTTLFQCPSRVDKTNGDDGLPDSYAANYSGNGVGGHKDYGNGAFAGPGSLPLSLAQFDSPGFTITLCETENNPGPAFSIDDAVNFPATNQILWAGHTYCGNYVFADGHVMSFHPQDTANSSKDSPNRWYRNPKRTLSANGQAILAATQANFAK